MSIGPVGGGAPINPNDPAYQQHLHFVQQEFKRLFTAFIQNPDPTNAQAVLDFMQSNQADLTALSQIYGYQPSPGGGWQNDFQATVLALTTYIQSGGKSGLDPSCEFINDVRQWIGVNLTPQDIKDDFEQMLLAFMNNPSPYLARGLEWVLGDPGYRGALQVYGRMYGDEGKLEQAMMNARLLLAQYRQNPSEELETATDTALKQILQSLTKLT